MWWLQRAHAQLGQGLGIFSFDGVKKQVAWRLSPRGRPHPVLWVSVLFQLKDHLTLSLKCYLLKGKLTFGGSLTFQIDALSARLSISCTTQASSGLCHRTFLSHVKALFVCSLRLWDVKARPQWPFSNPNSNNSGSITSSSTTSRGGNPSGAGRREITRAPCVLMVSTAEEALWVSSDYLQTWKSQLYWSTVIAPWLILPPSITVVLSLD